VDPFRGFDLSGCEPLGVALFSDCHEIGWEANAVDLVDSEAVDVSLRRESISVLALPACVDSNQSSVKLCGYNFEALAGCCGDCEELVEVDSVESVLFADAVGVVC
jgi:hypothetical protein